MTVLLALSLGAACSKDNPLHGLTGADDASSTAATSASTTDDSTSADATATGTTMGSTSTGGDPLDIVDRGVLVRYYLDEGSAGGMPTQVSDSTDMPLDLDLDYGGGNMSWAQEATGWGLRWDNAGQQGVGSALIEGSQFETVMDGSTSATIELVVEPEAVAPASSRFLHVGVFGSSARFTMSMRNIDQITLSLRDNATMFPSARFDVDVAGQRGVWHLVFDSTQADQQDRARLYVNGVEQMSVVEAITDGYGLEIDRDDPFELCLGNNPASPDGIRSFEGSLYYAAVYSEALTQSEIDNNVAVLLADDDSPVGS